jgi:homoserine O-succinyltransferase/O-acetyltransferase
MPRHAARRKASSEMNAIPARQSFDGSALQIALVNNMPDQAIEATKAQFAKLLRAGAGKVPFRLRCYTLSSVPRGETARRAISRSHEDIESLYARGADALIVTGSEPRADRLEREPYWEDFARLVDWARVHTISALWSCLAAHGAVLRLDGVTRHRAREKISGVFVCEVAANDWATRGAADSILVPHSRYNGLARSDLVERGYRISSWSGDVGVDCFWRREPSLFLFTQGHPEYNADTLAREFRRDALRFLTGQSDRFPLPPRNYFSIEAQAALDALRQSADSLDRPRLARMLGQIVESEAPPPAWANDAERLYRNWLELVALEKMREARADATA